MTVYYFRMKIFFLILCLFIFPSPSLSSPPDESYRIVIVKSTFTLFLYKGDSLQNSYKVAIGKNEGDKERVGDLKTPEGEFVISQIQNSSTWTHDFKDGKGKTKDAYGPWFFRLNTEATRTLSGKAWKGIAIHGTHDENSIGTRTSEGCVRLRNKDLEELRNIVYVGMPVVIKQ